LYFPLIFGGGRPLEFEKKKKKEGRFSAVRIPQSRKGEHFDWRRRGGKKGEQNCDRKKREGRKMSTPEV